ncbi:unnamed protein product [Tilletia controversa]|uniref:Uncharacterized protein n=2 Tax=Tilletia TaxID=13289 RepID=A0A8X7MV51_9BASI|nr:hypothetical protein CF336_g2655 [Tilletia laevis]KAE8196470.1 hypothetical protein CF328_g4127 [Tilletia controversa]KAE8261529.1 hypothetical protein A4X03_0g3179 [Tilletia caries]KAE8201982.1 hypothetical protein CF335_g3587 [Tilletia laevis]KAE8249669.1 hypothetical protein A4X06_0g3124 [Tilletia controversa]
MVDNLEAMLSTTRIVSRASDHISPPARSAVARFFDTPELVLMLLEHLHQYRIDLLVVAAVCKQLRPLALQAWMWHFDFDYKSFEGKLKLVQANSHLLAHIRCLRILSCNQWNEPGHHDSQRAPSLYWTKVESLFSLLSAHTSTYAQAPLLDIFINTADGESLRRTLQPYPGFLQRIAALRLLDSVPRYNRGNNRQDRQDHNMFRTLGWTSLALLLDDVLYLKPTAVALRVLEYQCSCHIAESQDPDRTAKKAFWCGVTTIAHRSLQELHLSIDGTDPATYVLQYGAFASLKRFELLAIGDVENDRIDSALIDTFLHRHTGLQQLSLSYIGSELARWDPVLDQAFPALHTLEFGPGVWPSDEAT